MNKRQGIQRSLIIMGGLVTIFTGLLLCFQSSDCALIVIIMNTIFGILLVTLGSLKNWKGVYYGGFVSIVATLTILDTTWPGVGGGLISLSGGLWIILSSPAIKRE